MDIKEAQKKLSTTLREIKSAGFMVTYKADIRDNKGKIIGPQG
jgi:hypothetical protein